MLDTVDYVWNDGSVVFRTCEREKSKLVFQIVSTVKPVLNDTYDERNLYHGTPSTWNFVIFNINPGKKVSKDWNNAAPAKLLKWTRKECFTLGYCRKGKIFVDMMLFKVADFNSKELGNQFRKK